MSQPPTPLKVLDVSPALEVTPQAAQASTPGAMAMLRAFRRRWPLALGGGLLTAVVVAAVAYFAIPPAKYTAVGQLQVKMFQPRLIFDPREKEADFAVLQQTQVALLKNRELRAQVLRDPDVAKLATVQEVAARAEDPVDWLEKQLTIGFVNKSEILQISMSGDRPQDIEVILTKIIKGYMERNVNKERKDREARLDQLRVLWTRYQEKLKVKREFLKKLAQTVGSDDRRTLSIKGQLSHEQLALAETERMRNRTELSKLQAKISVLELHQTAVRPAAGQPNVSDNALDEYMDADAESRVLREAVQKSRARFDKVFQGVRRPGDPALVEARQKYEAGRRALAARRDQLRTVLARKLGGTASDPGMELEQVKREALVLQQFDKELAKEVERLQKAIQALNETTRDLQAEQEEIATLSETAQKVGAEVEVMDVEMQATERIEVIDLPVAPKKRDDLKKLRVTGTAAVGAFAFVLAGVTFWEARARRVNTPEEVVQGLGFRLVGSLPPPQDPSRRRLAVGSGGPGYGNQWQSKLVESVDATRTMLLHAARADSLRIVMITSAAAGEGKTTLACHLTASLARAGRSTLLIDCDLRRPSAHRLFDQPSGPGVSELLRGEVSLDDVIRSTAAADLHMIPAGVCDAQAVQALAQGGLQQIFDTLRSRYDFIIVDSAPVLPVVDSLIISQHADAVIFSILRDVSRIPSVQDARDRLASLGVRILGAVVSGMPGASYSNSYASEAARTGALAAQQN